MRAPAPATPAPAPSPAPPAPPGWLVTRIFYPVKNWLFTGNPVAKFGLMILFIGVSFLLKYAAETLIIPIELRLAGVVLADLGLLAWGWRIRQGRREIGLPVQGAAIAILMLTVFGAFQRYQLIPAGLAFGLLFFLTAFTCLLAVLQNAVWLASFGIAGGFAAPILLSTGQGNHIALFSYYALLNAGIFAIAFKRAWRPLNLLGFVFTFVVGAAWGGLKYVPENYASAQGFLILFFLFYVGIAIAYASRQAPRMKKPVDASLILGTPLLAFGLQFGLVKDMPFGMALSALAFGAFYLVLARLLWSRARDTWRPLVETFLALGVVFATLALPMALDGRWTSAAWALEGAGLVWIGLRQQQTRTWVFGLLVQAGAWISFVRAVSGMDEQAAAQSNLGLGFLLLAGSTFGMATRFRRHSDDTGDARFSGAATGFLAIASFWLLGGFWGETMLRTNGVTLANLLVAGAFVTAVILNLIAGRLVWAAARKFAVVAQLAGAAALIVVAAVSLGGPDLFDIQRNRPLLGALMIAAGALYSSWALQRDLPEQTDKKLSSGLLLWAGFWWFGPVLFATSAHMALLLADEIAQQYDVWSAAHQALIALSAVGFAWLAYRIGWVRLRWFSATCWAVLAWNTGGWLVSMYGRHWIPTVPDVVGLAFLWAAGEYLMRMWTTRGWVLAKRPLQLLHLVRTAGPWLMIWPTGKHFISAWMHGSSAQQELMQDAGWSISGSWALYLPAWAMMAVIVWLIGRSRTGWWPTAPLPSWYRRYLLPCGAAWALLLVAAWNLRQDGAMEPLMYLPVLNPLDLTTGFAAVLAVLTYRMLMVETEGSHIRPLIAKWPFYSAFAAYAWFNLMLLRSACHYLDIPYRFDELSDSQFVQAMLSLVWSATALVVMRYAARRSLRRQWSIGAALLVVVVAKLFVADLSNSGSVARIVSFVGVGLLMLVIGYLAPYPKQGDADRPAEPAPVN